MDYLTQHYKNLSEQLQEKLNNLTELLEAYPGGMTPGRRKVLNRASQYDRSNPASDQMGRAVRARQISMQGDEADRRGARRAEATVSAMPDFHNTVIAHMATAFGDRYGENTGHGRQLTLRVAADLHKAAGEGGFRDYAHASSVMRDYMQNSGDVRNHNEQRAMEDPMTYSGRWDNVDGIDFDEVMDEDHADMQHDVLQAMLRKRT